MKRIRLITYVLSVLYAWACTEDKGNYNYTKLNDIVISGIDKEYVVEQFSPLNIPVTITGAENNFNEDRYEYLWYLWMVNNSDTNPDTLSYEKDLELDAVSVRIGEHALRYVVKDKETGLIYTARTNLKIINSFSEGVVALSDVEGDANVTFINLLDTVTQNVYRQVNGQSAGRNPRGIFLTGDDSSVKKMLLISTGDGTKIVEPTDFSSMLDFTDMFYLPPSSTVVGAICRSNWGFDEYIIMEGEIYYRSLFSGGFYQKYKPKEKGDYEAAPFSVYESNRPFFYDQKGRRFAYHDYSSVIPVEPNTGAFNSADMGAIMIYGTSVDGDIRAVMQDDDGRRFAIAGKQEVTYDRETWETFPRVIAVRKTELNKEGADQATCFAVSTRDINYLYYAYRNRIVCCGTQSGEVLATYDFEPGIVVDYMEFDRTKKTDRLFVGVSDGSGTANSGSIYYLKMDASGSLAEEKCFKNICGKVVDFEYNE